MTGGGGASLDERAKIDGGGLPYRQPFFFSPKENCYWLDNDCAGGPNGYCSFSEYSYTSVAIAGNMMTLHAIDSSGARLRHVHDHQGARSRRRPRRRARRCRSPPPRR